MANPEHLKFIDQGVEEWNAWRKRHVRNDAQPARGKSQWEGARRNKA